MWQIQFITTAQLHSTNPELRFSAGSDPARGMSEIRDGEDLWQWSRLEIRLNAFRRSTIPQKQFIIIIIKHKCLKKFYLNKVNGTKTALFFLSRAPTPIYLYVEFSIFDSVTLLLKFTFLFIKMHGLFDFKTS